MPGLTRDQLRDAGYVTVGLGVLAFQKAQVARVDLSNRFSTEKAKIKARLDEAGARQGVPADNGGTTAPGPRDASGPVLPGVEALCGLAHQVDRRLAPIVRTCGARVDDVVARLPEPVQGPVSQTRQHAGNAVRQVRHVVGLA